MAKVGTVYIEVKPDLRTFGATLRKALATQDDDVQKSGRKSGLTWGEAFKGALAFTIERDVGRVLVATLGITALLPQLTAGLVDLAGGATAAASGLAAAAGAAGLALGPALAALGQGVSAVALGFVGFGDAVEAQIKINSNLAAGIKPTKGELENLDEALAKLEPNARSAFNALFKLAPAFDKIRRSVQGNLFAGIDEVIRQLGTTYLPMFGEALAQTAGQINAVVQRGAAMAATPLFSGQIASILRTNGTLIDLAGQAMLNMTSAIVGLVNAAGPLAVHIAGLVTRATELLAAWVRTSTETGALSALMDRLKAAFDRVWSIAGNLGRALGSIFLATLPAGQAFLDQIDQLTAKFASWAASVGGQDALAAWATRGVAALMAVGGLIGDLVGVFSRLGEGADFTGFISQIRADLVPALESLFSQLAKPGASEALVGALTSLANVLAQLNVGGTIYLFVSAMESFLSIVNTALVTVPGLAPVLSGLLAAMAAVTMIRWTAAITGISGLTRAALAAPGALAAFRTALAGGEVVGAAGKMGVAFGGLKARIALLTPVLASFGGKVAGGLSKAGTAIAAMATKWLPMLAGALKAAGAAMLTNPIGLTITALVLLGTAFYLLWTKSETFRNAIKAVGEAILNFGKAIVSGVQSAVTWLVDTALPAVGNFIAGVGRFFIKVVDAMTTPFRWAVALILAIFFSLVGLVAGPVKAFFAFLVGGFIATRDAVVGAVVWIKDKIVGIWNAVYAFVVPILTTIRDWIVNAWNTVKDKVANTLSAIAEWITRTWTQISAKVKSTLDAIRRVVTDAWDGVKSKISEVLGSIASVISQKWDSFVSTIRGFASKVRNAAGEVFSKIVESLNLVDLYQKGVAMIQGFINGVMSMAGKLASSVRGFIERNVPQVVRDLLGIGSPSKLFESFGEDTVAGLIRGIVGGTGDLRSASAGMAEALIRDYSVRPSMVSTMGIGGLGGLGGAVNPSVRVFIGDRELTDIVKVELADSNALTARRIATTTGSGGWYS